MSERSLGKMTALLKNLDLEVTYAYDDLVFVQHSAFLLQFTDNPAQLKLFSNTDCDPKEAGAIISDVVGEFAKAGVDVLPSGRFSLKPNDNETLDIEFLGN
jgi:hypothetical protein